MRRRKRSTELWVIPALQLHASIAYSYLPATYYLLPTICYLLLPSCCLPFSYLILTCYLHHSSVGPGSSSRDAAGLTVLPDVWYSGLSMEPERRKGCRKGLPLTN